MSSATIIKTANDPRASLQSTRDVSAFNLHDPNVRIEEYVYYASITRAEEKLANEEHVRIQGPTSAKSIVLGRFSKGKASGAPASPPATDVTANEKNSGGVTTPPSDGRGHVTDAEWKTASRALRTCGWGSIFYLITTDILGPFSTP